MFDEETDDEQELIEDLDAGDMADKARGGYPPIKNYTEGHQGGGGTGSICTCCQISVA